MTQPKRRRRQRLKDARPQHEVEAARMPPPPEPEFLKHKPCGTLTEISAGLAQAMRRHPGGHPVGWCAHCGNGPTDDRFPIGEFEWPDGDPLVP